MDKQTQELLALIAAPRPTNPQDMPAWLEAQCVGLIASAVRAELDEEVAAAEQQKRARRQARRRVA